MNIYIKKLVRNRPGAVPVSYEYPETIETVRELIRKTVRLNLREYEKGKQETDLPHALLESGRIRSRIHIC